MSLEADDLEELVRDRLEEADTEEPEQDPNVQTVEISPFIMLVRTLEALDTMRDWADDSRNGELMGQAAAGYLEIHDRLLMLAEEQEETEKAQHFGFKSLGGNKNGRPYES